jgi:hypothetical protein
MFAHVTGHLLKSGVRESSQCAYPDTSWTTARCDCVSIARKSNEMLQVSYDARCAVRHFENIWISDVHSLTPRQVEIALVRNAEVGSTLNQCS